MRLLPPPPPPSLFLPFRWVFVFFLLALLKVTFLLYVATKGKTPPPPLNLNHLLTQNPNLKPSIHLLPTTTHLLLHRLLNHPPTPSTRSQPRPCDPTSTRQLTPHPFTTHSRRPQRPISHTIHLSRLAAPHHPTHSSTPPFPTHAAHGPATVEGGRGDFVLFQTPEVLLRQGRLALYMRWVGGWVGD